MAHAPPIRQSIVPSSARQSNISSLSHSNNAQSSNLQARIASKKVELENLKGLRDLSAQLATQMSTLEAKLAMLKDGTESVACILANWDNVLRAISMASSKIPKSSEEMDISNDGTDLPVTLVRIPVQQKTGEEG